MMMKKSKKVEMKSSEGALFDESKILSQSLVAPP